MDTGEGRFKQFNEPQVLNKLFKEHPNHGSVFKVGEKLTIKESIFEIVEIRPKGMNLKLLKRGL